MNRPKFRFLYFTFVWLSLKSAVILQLLALDWHGYSLIGLKFIGSTFHLVKFLSSS